MKTELKNTNKKKFIIILSSIVILIVLASVAIYATLSPNSSKKDQLTSSANVVNTETKSKVITGTGIIEAKDQFDITSTATGKIISAPFEEGQFVNAGDILYNIDTIDIMNNIDKLKVGVEKAQLAYNLGADNVNKLTVRSNISGTITELYINKGDMVQPNGKVAYIVNDEVMVLKVPFIESSTKDFYEGESVSVTIVGSFYTTQGTIKKITSGHGISADGSIIKMIEVNVPNPGTINKGFSSM